MPFQDYRKRFPVTGSPRREIHFRETEWDILQDDGQVDRRVRARMESLMKLYCENGPQDMHEKMFRFLSHYQARRRQIRLEEFKSGPVRIFGFAIQFEGKAVFFATGIDVDKKQRKANPRRVEAAGNEAIRIVERIDGNGE